MKNINSIINDFSNFLNISWDSFEKIVNDFDITDDYIRDDWLQVNWELLVENKICPQGPFFLEIYSCGADCNGDSSRVTYHTMLPTHKLICKQRNDISIRDYLNNAIIIIPETGFSFEELVSMQNGWYQRMTPFNMVLLIDDSNIERVFNINDIDFFLEKIDFTKSDDSCYPKID